VVGEAAGEDVRNAIAGTDALNLTSAQRALLHVVVEGERDGLPVYCLDGPRFRLRGRAIPNRLLITPQEAGLADAEVHWNELRPGRDGAHWNRNRVPEGEARWTLELQSFLPDPRVPKEAPPWGTGRFAAAVGVPGPGGAMNVLGSPGWGRGAPSPEPGETPGFRVSRAAGPTLAGNALALARLPVLPDATAEQARLRVALRPVDLVLAGYEHQCDAPLPPTGSTSLDDPEWDWLFATLRDGIRRRTVPGAPAVGPDARAVRWGHEGVVAGDVLVMDGALAILDADDGDGWLGEADSVVATVSGEIRKHVLHDVGGRNVRILRARDFQGIRFDLVRAGYGSLGVTPRWGADLFRAVREFQHDRGMTVTGIPDEATRNAILEFLDRMRSSTAGEDASSP
jgi:hypothetical protein